MLDFKENGEVKIFEKCSENDNDILNMAFEKGTE